MNHVKTSKGFTLIELMLAMAFISVLLLAVAMTVIQIGKIYNRGITLKEVNQVSRTLTDELTRSIASSPSFSLSASAGKYAPEAWGGRLCLGQYSFIWNYGTALNNNNPNRSRYSSGSNTIQFVKVPDLSGTYCVRQPSGYPNISPTNAVELLGESDRDLAIHRISVSSASTAVDPRTGQQLYTVTFTIGTNDTAALVTDGSGYVSSCKTPDQLGFSFEYCTVQQFTIAVRTQNAVN
jgi:prepilin-type N-terminal cleavage/methylation domain-containing protein